MEQRGDAMVLRIACREMVRARARIETFGDAVVWT
jgi:hypothetical protein